jgi:hypothetical protein
VSFSALCFIYRRRLLDRSGSSADLALKSPASWHSEQMLVKVALPAPSAKAAPRFASAKSAGQNEQTTDFIDFLRWMNPAAHRSGVLVASGYPLPIDHRTGGVQPGLALTWRDHAHEVGDLKWSKRRCDFRDGSAVR